MPKYGGAARYVADATRLVPDERARHYWDESGAMMRAYTTVLDLSEDAWDIYMIYGPEATWDSALPPPPDYWMHQLGSKQYPRVDGPFLDGHILADEARQRRPGPAGP